MPATTLATTAAITAVTTMNKPIQAKSESMGAKSMFNSCLLYTSDAADEL